MSECLCMREWVREGGSVNMSGWVGKWTIVKEEWEERSNRAGNFEAIFHHFETPLFETPNKVKRREPAFSNVGLRQGFILTLSSPRPFFRTNLSVFKIGNV